MSVTSDAPPVPLSRKLKRLVETLAKEFAAKQCGHCARVDHLSPLEAQTACRELRNQKVNELDTYVLTSDRAPALLDSDLGIYADRAIELRNRKQSSLCLFVPADLLDVTASSLGNSFAPFDLPAFLRSVKDELFHQLPDAVLEQVGSVMRQMKGGARVSREEEIEYLSAVLDAPTPETVGAELWRVGLIPDFAEEYLSDAGEFARRLELNRRCVDTLARPLRPQSSTGERVQALKLVPGPIQRDLTQYLAGRRLQSDRQWLRDLADDEQRGRLSFDCWQFPESAPADLKGILIEPFTRASGLEGIGEENIPEAICGKGRKIAVKWKPDPVKPSDVAQWRVEMLPSPQAHDPEEVEGVDLPVVTVRASSRTARLPLEMEDSSLSAYKLVVRVTGIDSNGAEILDDDNLPVVGDSAEFYLQISGEDGIPPPELCNLPTDRCLADALLAYSLLAKEVGGTVKTTSLPVEERDALYLPFKINDRTIARVSTTPFLAALQTHTLQNSDQGGRYEIIVRGIDPLNFNADCARPLDFSASLPKEWADFTHARRRIFEAIRKQRSHEPSLIESSDMTSLLNPARSYATAYRDLLDAALADPDMSSRLIADLLSLDTLTLSFSQEGQSQAATVYLPTHPLRLLWHTAYSAWLQDISEQLRALPKNARTAKFDRHILQELAPFNLPAFRLHPAPANADTAEMFADNLGLFYGVTLPINAPAPGSLLTETARLLGYTDYQPCLTTMRPETLAAELDSYLKLHPYIQTLRINALNPGSGEFLRAAIEQTLKQQGTEDEDSQPGLGLDLITHTAASTQLPAPGLDSLASGWYRQGWRARGSHLLPGVQCARRPMDALADMPGDVHLAICLDHYAPQIALTVAPSYRRDRAEDPADASPVEAETTSAAVFGLLTRFQNQFHSREDGAEWTRKVAFGGPGTVERHPTDRKLSDLLLALQDATLRLSARVWDNDADANTVPGLRLSVGPEAQKTVDLLHQQADWVLTIDRNFGVEYYDSPSDANLAVPSSHYLLDYTPEFLEGLGHRLVVTTRWQEEVSDVLARAMQELGLANSPETVRELLSMLKTLSGRLALRLIGEAENTQAKEAVSMAVVANYLLHKKELDDCIIIPLDAHKRLLRDAKRKLDASSMSHCDLLLIRPGRKELRIDFVEVKYRQGASFISEALLTTIQEQIKRTEKTFRDLYFAEPARLDAPILRCQLAAILRFYAERAKRHGRIKGDEQYAEMLANIARVETGGVKMTSRFLGYVVNLQGQPVQPYKHGELIAHVLTGMEVEQSTSFRCADTFEPIANEAEVPATQAALSMS